MSGYIPAPKRLGLRERQAAADWRRAFSKGESPRFCPVRIDKNPLNRSGNVCGDPKFVKDPPPEEIRSEAGAVIGWRCARGHIFGRAPLEGTIKP